MSSYKLAYGKGQLEFSLPDEVRPRTIVPASRPSLDDPLTETEAVLKNPIGTPPLAEMLRQKRPAKIVVVLNDITRPTPYPVLLPPLLKAFSEAGIEDRQVTFLIALGTHVPHTDQQNREVYGDELVDRFTVVNHDGGNPEMLVNLGPLEAGYDFVVNRLAAEADFLITLGVVMPHYFAGYSGGRKSILPGLVSTETVAANHARMVEIMDSLPPIDENPVSREMISAARRVGVDFILNAVPNNASDDDVFDEDQLIARSRRSQQGFDRLGGAERELLNSTNLNGLPAQTGDEAPELISVVAGDVAKAWRRAVDVSASVFEVPFEEQADVVVACASGYPRDINAYQAQKGLDHADQITRTGGTIIFAAECEAGWGNDVFEEWVSRKWPAVKVIQEIKCNFVLGGHKAYAYAKVAAEKEVWFISSLSAQDTEMLWAKKAATVQEAVDAVLRKHGPGASWVYMPDGSLSLPVRRR
jgi:lactate racemase